MLLASSEYTPEILPNTLQHTGKPQTQNDLTQNSTAVDIPVVRGS